MKTAGILLLLQSLLSTVALSTPNHELLKPYSWHYTNRQSNGVFVLAHGLNQKPLTMLPLAQLLNDEGFDVLHIALSGHQGASEYFATVNAEQWLRETQAAYTEARLRAQKINKPLNLAAFSMGALLNLNLMASPTDPIIYDKLLLFAPALSLRWYATLLKPLFIFGDSFVYPSYSPVAYRANSGTTTAGYKALFDLIERFEKSTLSPLNVPSLLIIDPQDETISFSGIKKMIEQNSLNQWQIITVNNNNSLLSDRFHHLVIDENSVGLKQWELIKHAVHTFLHPALLELHS